MRRLRGRRVQGGVPPKFRQRSLHCRRRRVGPGGRPGLDLSRQGRSDPGGGTIECGSVPGTRPTRTLLFPGVGSLLHRRYHRSHRRRVVPIDQRDSRPGISIPRRTTVPRQFSPPSTTDDQMTPDHGPVHSEVFLHVAEAGTGNLTLGFPSAPGDSIVDENLACSDLCEENGFTRQAELLRAISGNGGKAYVVIERGSEYNDEIYSPSTGGRPQDHLPRRGRRRAGRGQAKRGLVSATTISSTTATASTRSTDLSAAELSFEE